MFRLTLLAIWCLKISKILFDRLDSNKEHGRGELLGEHVFQLIKEFDESEDRPEYLEDYSVS